MSRISLGYPEKYGGAIDIEIKGMDVVAHAMEKLTELVPELCGEAMHEYATETIMPLARERVPVRTGELMASSHVNPPDTTGGGVQVSMGFGGPPGVGNQAGETNNVDVDYAVYVHEDLMMPHSGGQAKYLETALADSLPGMVDALAKKVAGKMDDAS